MSGSQLWLRFSILAASFPALARALLSDPRHSQSHEGWEAALLRAGEVGVRASRYLREMTPDRVLRVVEDKWWLLLEVTEWASMCSMVIPTRWLR